MELCKLCMVTQRSELAPDREHEVPRCRFAHGND